MIHIKCRDFPGEVHWGDIDKPNMESLISKVNLESEFLLAQITKINIQVRVTLNNVDTPENKSMLTELQDGACSDQMRHGCIGNVIGT